MISITRVLRHTVEVQSSGHTRRWCANSSRGAVHDSTFEQGKRKLVGGLRPKSAQSNVKRPTGALAAVQALTHEGRPHAEADTPHLTASHPTPPHVRNSHITQVTTQVTPRHMTSHPITSHEVTHHHRSHSLMAASPLDAKPENSLLTADTRVWPCLRPYVSFRTCGIDEWIDRHIVGLSDSCLDRWIDR